MKLPFADTMLSTVSMYPLKQGKQEGGRQAFSPKEWRIGSHTLSESMEIYIDYLIQLADCMNENLESLNNRIE